MESDIIYLVHDLHDAAVIRRIKILKQSFRLQVFGFERLQSKCNSPQSTAEQISLGITKDSRLWQRCASALLAIPIIFSNISRIKGAQIFICRNLENAVLAILCRYIFHFHFKIIYECLDIPRHLTTDGLLGAVLRYVERVVLKRVQAVLTSSPGFVEEYFLPSQYSYLPIFIVENKLIEEPKLLPGVYLERPYKIGYFGILRCQKSFILLTDLALRRSDLVAIQLAGRPFRDVFPHFEDDLIPEVRYFGPYTPQDLPFLYERIQFTWTVDFFEPGFNSSWLLPNRLYESLALSRIPIAVRGTECARFIEQRDLGIVLDNISELELFLDSLSNENFRKIQKKLENVRREDFLFLPEDSRNLAEKLRVLSSSSV